MTITLADIEASEKICESVVEGPWWANEGIVRSETGALICRTWDDLDAAFGPSSEVRCAHFIAHARTQLPKMNKLALEMLEIIELATETECCECLDGDCDTDNCATFRAHRLVERMEADNVD